MRVRRRAIAMDKLHEKIKLALDETRVLVLATQVLLLFHYEAVFEPKFTSLPRLSQILELMSLTLLLITFALLVTAPAYHQLTFKGEDSISLHECISRLVDSALLPFAVAMSVAMYIAVCKVAGQAAGIGVGAAFFIASLFLWYGLCFLVPRSASARRARQERKQMTAQQRRQPADTSLHDKIVQAVTESRIVLPGAQAMLGFQFVVLVMREFDQLPASSKFIHMLSLLMIALTCILLITPSAYHRIAERGEDSERFFKIAGTFVIAAMVPLALGMAGDFFVVVRKASNSTALGCWAAGLLLLVFYGLWFGFTLWHRMHADKPSAKHEKASEPVMAG